MNVDGCAVCFEFFAEFFVAAGVAAVAHGVVVTSRRAVKCLKPPKALGFVGGFGGVVSLLGMLRLLRMLHWARLRRV